MTGAFEISGGIANCNHNILIALKRLTEDKGLNFKILSLYDSHYDDKDNSCNSTDFKGFKGNKVRFSLELIKNSIIYGYKSIYLFDHVTLVKPILPFVKLGLIKPVIFAHGSESWKKIRKSSVLSFGSAQLVLANSNHTLNKMKNQMPNINLEACPLGLSPSFALNNNLNNEYDEPIHLLAGDEIDYALGDRVLLLVARMHPNEREKGHYQLIDVLPNLLKKHPDVQLVFPGDGEDKNNIIKYAKDLNVAPYVFTPGYVETDELIRFYKKCYSYVMPSTQEGFGLSYLEAMNYGKPCVGCYGQGAEDIIVNGETGYLVHDPNDSKELETCLLALLSNPSNARKIGRNGFYRLHKYFTPKRYQVRIKQHIGKLLFN